MLTMWASTKASSVIEWERRYVNQLMPKDPTTIKIKTARTDNPICRGRREADAKAGDEAVGLTEGAGEVGGRTDVMLIFPAGRRLFVVRASARWPSPVGHAKA